MPHCDSISMLSHISGFTQPRLPATCASGLAPASNIRVKVQRHIKAPLTRFPGPKARFHHVNVDLAVPPRPSHGYDYILTCVDHITRCPQAITIHSPTSEGTKKAFLAGRVSIFGCHAADTIDRGSHFDGALSNLIKIPASQ